MRTKVSKCVQKFQNAYKSFKMQTKNSKYQQKSRNAYKKFKKDTNILMEMETCESAFWNKVVLEPYEIRVALLRGVFNTKVPCKLKFNHLGLTRSVINHDSRSTCGG